MKTHWKTTLDKDWIGVYILPEGKPIVVKLISVKFEKVTVRGVEGKHRVAYFEKNEYFKTPMLFNASINLSRLERLTGTPYMEDWAELDLFVTLQKEMDKTFGGGLDWALRIAESKPVVELIELTPNDSNWPKVVKVGKNGITIEQIKGKYKLSKENENKLKEEIK